MMKCIEICPVVSDKKIFKDFYMETSGNPTTSLTSYHGFDYWSLPSI